MSAIFIQCCLLRLVSVLFSVVSMLVECSLQSCLELAVKNYTQRSHRDSPRWPWLVYQVCSYGNTDEQWMGLDPHSTHISSAAFHDIVIMGWLCFFHCCFFKCVAIATSWYTSVINDVRTFFRQIFLLGCCDWGSVLMIPSDQSWREVCPSSGSSMCIHQLAVCVWLMCLC